MSAIMSGPVIRSALLRRLFAGPVLSAGFGSTLPQDGTPTLILDFAPVADAAFGSSLSLSFVTNQYTANAPDPSTGGVANIQVWN